MKTNVTSVVNKVYPKISKDYGSNATVKLYSNIYERLDGVINLNDEFECYAEYLWDSDEIVLYTDNMESEEDIIRSLIHECVHSKQDYDIYEACYDQCDVDYETHPCEIEAEYEEEKWINYKLNTNAIG